MDRLGTRAWGSPSRYIQGAGEIERLPLHTDKFGKKAFAVITKSFYVEYRDLLQSIYQKVEGDCLGFEFKSEITEILIAEATSKAKEFNPNVIIGMGGGKALDTAKAVAHYLNLPVVIIPTCASTDAPTSAMSILYDEEHKHAGYVMLPQNPSLVLVDSQIIAEAPVRFLVAGMGDALATVFEGRASVRSNKPNYISGETGNYIRTRTAIAIAEESYKAILEYGVRAKIANENKEVTEALEIVIEANTLMSGLGFENIGCAASHSVCNGITKVPSSNKSLHGEKVAFGVICQLIAENASEQLLDEVIRFNMSVGLPITLEDMGVEPTEENFDIISSNSQQTEWSREPFYIDDEIVKCAIKRAQKLGWKYKTGNK